MLDTSHGFAGIVSSVLKMFDVALPVLVALALVLFMVGVVRYINSEGDKEKGGFIMWSLITLFVLVSVWGILRILMATFIPGQGTSVQTDWQTGKSYGPY